MFVHLRLWMERVSEYMCFRTPFIRVLLFFIGINFDETIKIMNRACVYVRWTDFVREQYTNADTLRFAISFALSQSFLICTVFPFDCSLAMNLFMINNKYHHVRVQWWVSECRAYESHECIIHLLLLLFVYLLVWFVSFRSCEWHICTKCQFFEWHLRYLSNKESMYFVSIRAHTNVRMNGYV